MLDWTDRSRESAVAMVFALLEEDVPNLNVLPPLELEAFDFGVFQLTETLSEPIAFYVVVHTRAILTGCRGNLKIHIHLQGYQDTV